MRIMNTEWRRSDSNETKNQRGNGGRFVAQDCHLCPEKNATQIPIDLKRDMRQEPIIKKKVDKTL